MKSTTSQARRICIKYDCSNDTVRVVKGQGDTIPVNPRLQLMGQADDGDIHDNNGQKEENHKLGTEHGNW